MFKNLCPFGRPGPRGEQAGPDGPVCSAFLASSEPRYLCLRTILVASWVAFPMVRPSLRGLPRDNLPPVGCWMCPALPTTLTDATYTLSSSSVLSTHSVALSFAPCPGPIEHRAGVGHEFDDISAPRLSVDLPEGPLDRRPLLVPEVRLKHLGRVHGALSSAYPCAGVELGAAVYDFLRLFMPRITPSPMRSPPNAAK